LPKKKRGLGCAFLQPFNAQIFSKNAVFDREISCCGCHDTKWALVLLKTAFFFNQKGRFPED